MKTELQAIAIPLFLGGFALAPWPPYWMALVVMGIAVVLGLLSLCLKD